MSELMVRMAEIAVSQRRRRRARRARAGLVHRRRAARRLGRGRPALAHVVLPGLGARHGATAGAGQVRRHRGARAARRGAAARRARARGLYAVLVGGAQMFSPGRRRAWTSAAATRPAVRAALAAAGMPVRAAVTGGGVGRTHPRLRRHRPGHLQGGRRHGDRRLPRSPTSDWRRQHEAATSSPTTQVAALVEAAKQGQAAARGGARRAAALAARARHRLLPARASSRQDQQRRLERAHEAFCRTASTQLSAELLTDDRAGGARASTS